MSDADKLARRSSIGGSDARIIMSGDQFAVEDIWMEKRGESIELDFSEVVLIQLGNITEEFNADVFEHETGLWVTDMQQKVRHPDWEHAHATLDGKVRNCPDCPEKGIFEAKFMLPFNWSLEDAVKKYYGQLQHNMWVTGLETAYLSVLTGGGMWKMAEVKSDFFYQVAMEEAEREFWEAVQSGTLPNFPKAADTPIVVERTKIVDMKGNNEWSVLAGTLTETVEATKKHDSAKRKIKKLFPEDAMIAHGYGVKMKRGKDGRALYEITPAVPMDIAA
ncbi:YqaJ viral recombinase family protein [Methylobacterium sp. WL120]|uniref:YqaJ viral recombinase family protein n=1 Tax=Methylobacterium sp. WL120 TaxID=2603887 RepID=UPI00164FBB40|nr:YqaJ viral recombinase family protein [Methylobacterium sp. WL120]